jgi:hypothetical protein
MRVLSFLLLLICGSVPALSAPSQIVAGWVQMAPGGAAEARVVMQGAACPMAMVDGTRISMRVRAAPDDKFPVALCAVTLSAAAKHVAIEGQNLALPKPAPERILVLGDTGCRIKGATIQACNDPSGWPFQQVAAHAAALKPDLVIHVGDYLYRETPCPAGEQRCAGSPSGDNWTTWAADFFTPAKPLLDAAPWVVVRGNHEECARAGAGFLRLLGPLAFAEGAPCADHVAPYAVPLGAVNLIVMDNASAVDRGPSDELVRTYQADFAALPKLASKPTWLAMHHPIWGVVKLELGIVVGGNSTLMEAEDSAGIPPAVDLMLAGHIHTFEAMNYEKGLPPQLIVGEGGDLLDAAPADLTGRSVGAAKIADGLSLPGYGFLLLTHAGDHWTVDVFDATGARERSCTFVTRHIDCPKS